MHVRISRGTAQLLAAVALVLMASPGSAQTLYGVSHATGASQLRSINPATGSSAAIIGLGLDAVVSSAVAVANGGSQVYVAGRLAGADVLAVVNPAGPSSVTRPLDHAFANFRARADGKLVGLARTGALWEVRAIDPANGSSTLLAAAPTLASVVPAAFALRSGVAAYQVGRLAGDPTTPRLFVFNPSTGALAGTPALARDFHSLHLRGDGALLGLAWNGAAEVLYEIDPSSGASVAVRTFPAFGVLPVSASVVDRGAGRVYQVGHAAGPGDAPRLYSEAASGAATPANVGLSEGYAALAHSSESLVSVGGGVPHSLSLATPYPNPFSDATAIQFSLERAGRVDVDILDVAGRVVHTLAAASLEAGPHAIVWRGENAVGGRVAPGVYMVHMRAGGRDLVRRVVKIK